MKEILGAGYDFVVLDESVSNEDNFEDSTHDKVSHVLERLISSASRGFTIGLEGGWGSGKSTVINLLREKFESKTDTKTLYFMFDAWAHEGDPLRRIFLESLIQKIDPNRQNAQLEKISQQVSRRTKTVDVTSKKSVSKLGKILSFSALLIPAGAVLLRKVDFATLYLPFSSDVGQPHWPFLISIIFSFAPIFVLIGWFFFGDKDVNGKRIWDVFQSESKESYTQDITEDGERTSIEFERFFEEIMEVVTSDLDTDGYSKVVLVVDNLDRISSGGARSVWATLQTFFQHRSSANFVDNSWVDKLFFIVPYDRDGFDYIWRGPEPYDSENDSKSLSDSFLDKCFQVVVDVPPPVMSAWVAYAEHVINESLTGWPEGDRGVVLECFQRYMGMQKTSPTPRMIKTFVNRVGGIGLRWGAEMSVESMCLYSLYRVDYTQSEMMRMLRDGQPDDGYEYFGDRSQILSELAGIFFGVSSEKGIQLLLEPVIEEAVSTGDGVQLRKLADTHRSAFWIVWQQGKIARLDEIESDEGYRFSATEAIFHGLSEYKNLIESEVEEVFDSYLKNSAKWDFGKNDYSVPFEALIQLSSQNPSLLESLSKETRKMLQKVTSSISELLPSSKTLVNVNKLLGVLSSHDSAIPKLHYKTLGVLEWKDWLLMQDKHGVVIDSVLPSKDLVTELVDKANFNQVNLIAENIELLLKTIEIHPTLVATQNVTSKIAGWLKLPNRQSPLDNVYQLVLRIFGSGNSQAISLLEDVIKTKEFWGRSSQEQIAQVPTLPLIVAACFGSEIQNDTTVSAACKLFWSDAPDDAECERIYVELKNANIHKILWLLARDKSNKTAIEIIKNYSDDSLFSFSYGTFYIDEYGWISDEELSRFVNRLRANGSFEEAKSTLEENILPYHEVVNIMQKNGGEAVRKYLDKQVAKISKDEWKSTFESEVGLLKCSGAKDYEYTEGFVSYFKELLAGDPERRPQEWVLNNFESLLDRTSDKFDIVIPALANSYFSYEDDIEIDIFESVVVHLGSALGEIDEKYIMQKVNSWLAQKRLTHIRWLLESGFILLGEPLELLISRVTDGIVGDDQDIAEICNEMNSKWNLNISRKVEPEKGRGGQENDAQD